MGQKVVYLTTGLLTELIRQGAVTHCLVVEGLPWDAQLIRVMTMPDYSIYSKHSPERLGLIYESGEWPQLHEGDHIPTHVIKFERIAPDQPTPQIKDFRSLCTCGHSVDVHGLPKGCRSAGCLCKSFHPCEVRLNYE